jgi:hypothetical protein
MNNPLPTTAPWSNLRRLIGSRTMISDHNDSSNVFCPKYAGFFPERWRSQPSVLAMGIEFAKCDTQTRNEDETYHRRSVVESVLASLRRRFDDTIRARTWFGQFREIGLKALVKNIETASRH